MPAITPDLGHGAAITLSLSTGFASRITGLSWGGIERAAVDASTFATSGGKPFLPGDNYDPGALQVTMQFDTDAAVPITGAEETLTLTFPDLETWAAAAFLQSFEISLENEEIMEAVATFKLTGSITF